MKKYICILLSLSLVLCLLSGCVLNINESALVSKFEVNGVSDYKISNASGLGLKLLNYNTKGFDDNIYLLAYLHDKNMEVNSENNYIKSLAVGKTCISLTSTVLDVGRSLNNNIMKDLLQKLNTELSKENMIELYRVTEEGKYYIISTDGTYVFIDYLTTIPKDLQKVIYYRIILQDITTLNIDITEKEMAVLPDFLTELLEILDIEEEIVIPK